MSNTKKQFGEDTPALAVIEGIDLTGYEIVITGANSGIGVETLRALAKAGARCVLCSRDVEKAKPVRDDIIQSTGNSNIEIEQLELDSLDNVDAFVKRFLENYWWEVQKICVGSWGSWNKGGLETCDGDFTLGQQVLAGLKVLGKGERGIRKVLF